MIPTPETEELKEKVVETLHHDPFKQPKQYIHVQGELAKAQITWVICSLWSRSTKSAMLEGKLHVYVQGHSDKGKLSMTG